MSEVKISLFVLMSEELELMRTSFRQLPLNSIDIWIIIAGD